jgi:hypothetical protein
MIVPSAAEMLKTVERTFESAIKPDLSTTATRSAAATISHMLRIATLRIEIEGQILFEEAATLRALLPRVQSFLGAGTMPPERDASLYPSLALMAGEVGALRQGVCDALEALPAHERAGEALLKELHEYLAWQLEQEGRLIDPATIGHGPRR